MAGYKNEEWLRQEYYENGRALSDIADEFDVTIGAVAYYMDKYDMPRRRRGAREGEKNPAWRGGGVECECPTCGDTFETTRHKSRTAKHGPFCSRECMYEHRSEHIGGEDHHLHGVNPEETPCYGRTGDDHPMYGVRGEEHPNWKGGYVQDFRDTAKWQDARRGVFKRDGEICSDCGIDRDQHQETFGRDLEIHHIEPVSEGGSKYDLENLEPLCMACHHERHREL